MNQNNEFTPPRPSRQASYFTGNDGNLVRREPMVWNPPPPVMRDCIRCGEPAWVSPDTPWQNALCENHAPAGPVDMDVEGLLPLMPRRSATVAPARVPVATRQNGSNFTAPPDKEDGWTWDSFAPRALLAEYEKQLPSKGVTAQVLLGWFNNPDPVTHPAWAAYARRYERELTEFENARGGTN